MSFTSEMPEYSYQASFFRAVGKCIIPSSFVNNEFVALKMLHILQ